MGPSGIGIGLRPEIATDLLADPRRVDFVEVVAESALARPDLLREARALSELWPVVPHGVKLSLASADGIDLDRARRLGEVARAVRAPVITEHVALVRAGRREIGHLTAVPFTREAAAVVARNADRARRVLPDVPFLLENVAWTLRWPDDAMGEGAFHDEVARATGCGLLLDVANVYGNARNAGVDPVALLDSYPLDAVRMIHVAGGVFEDGFWFDTHAHAVPEDVFRLVARALERCGDVPVVLERDGAFPPFEELAREVDALRAIRGAAGPAPRRALDVAARRELDRASIDALAERQDLLAAALVDGATAHAFDDTAIRRTRTVLSEKRVDDALPLLPKLGRRREVVEAIARAGLASWPRPDALVGPADAIRIAETAADDPALEADARLDLLELQARFVGPGTRGEVRPRVGPFVGRARVRGATVWAFKPPGAGASVRMVRAGGGVS